MCLGSAVTCKVEADLLGISFEVVEEFIVTLTLRERDRSAAKGIINQTHIYNEGEGRK